ncbi:rod shape-determining protein MreC [Porphyrobacter algicida]|uniref:Cell shape-determining protein MreC n=1 Tax=Qipengyuania algicida TaxID=1836209 RepID=A0A845AG60_9SPHN|nr:rod shape-determining protein MreC [Qipengyuania algicida]MXP28389.1 rod shape-determining protein MreC [Qipengyuania algicida]
MAPNAQRRSSYSRRAQYTQFTGYIVAGVGALVGAVLLGVSLWHPAFMSGLRDTAHDGIEPAASGVAVARASSRNLMSSIEGYLRAGSQNAALKREVEIARIRLKEASALRQENETLKALLGLRDQQIKPVTVARLVGSSASSSRRFAYLGAGRDKGVEIGMPVVSARGVIGRILEVGDDSSRVLLLTDSESVVPVRRSYDQLVAFADGRGDGLLRIRLINLGINPLKIGDMFVTSGAGGFYQPNKAVAIVVEKNSDGGLARIVSDPAATDFVAVMPIFEPKASKTAQTPVEQKVGE